MDKQPPGADPLAFISRDLSAAPAGGKQSMFVDRVSMIGNTIRGLDPEMVEQKLWDIAEAHKLTGKRGSGTEEFILGVIDSAVVRVIEEGKPSAANGHDDEPPLPAGPQDYGSATI